ncbi:MAG: UvrD-helicase domain-containing protein [Acidimicrobiales bacterium]
MDGDALLDGLDPSQRRAVTSTARPLAILAGPGSGKTRVLTRRIAHRCLTGDADARHVLAVTFTRKAAAELDDRLRAFGLRDLPAAGTFHALAYAQLRSRWAAMGTAAPVLLDRKARILGRILGGTTRMSAADVANEIEWAKARQVTPDGYPLAAAQADRRLPLAPDRIAEWYRRYEEEKRRRGAVDFDDLLIQCASAIEIDPSFAAAQRWRFRHLFVDEYQDLNPLQDRLLCAWLGDSGDLCVVGDPNQAIYGWNGADPSFLVRFADRHPGGEMVALDRSYRSSPQILATAAAVIGGVIDAATARPSVQAVRADGPVPTVVGYATDVDEANGVARAVHDHHAPGRPWSSQAILVRTNAQATLFEGALRRAAIPYRVRGGRGLLDLPDVVELLRDLDHSPEPLATILADLAEQVDRRRDELEDGPLEASASGRRVMAHESVLRLGRDLLVVDPAARTDALGGWLRATLRNEDTTGRNAVSIVSFHAAKGLEWPVVHLTGLEAGLVPITHARTPAARAEERRLLFVAITRAADVLRCSWAGQRTFGATVADRKPSPLLTLVQASAAEVAADAVPDASSTGLAEARRRLLADTATDATASVVTDVETGPGSLRGELRSWRSALARAAAVAPTVVLSDRALEAVAHRRPLDGDALAALDDLGPMARARHADSLLAIVGRHRGPDHHPLVAGTAADRT